MLCHKEMSIKFCENLTSIIFCIPTLVDKIYVKNNMIRANNILYINLSIFGFGCIINQISKHENSGDS